MRTVVLLFRLICWPQRGIVGANQHQCGVPMSEEDSSFLCSICFKPIRPEKCKIDKEGRAVYEQCHLDKMRFVPSDKNARHEKRWRDLGRRLTRLMGWR